MLVDSFLDESDDGAFCFLVEADGHWDHSFRLNLASVWAVASGASV
jgi:hypothetical protein